jgi:hypothetical protein
MGGLIGTCLKCGASYCGWALTNPEHQKCDRCGSELEIRRDDLVIQAFDFPSRAEEFKAAMDRENWEDMLMVKTVFQMGRN